MDVATPPTSSLLARTETQKEAAARLRYDVYIAEQGKPYPDANHQRRTWGDALDDSADIVLVVDESNAPVGTVRANSFACNLTHRLYSAVFGIDEFETVFGRHEMVVCSRLAVHPAHRHASVRDALFETIYAHRLVQGTRLCFATCARVLLRMFRGYGFREYAPPINDPNVGPLHRVVLVLDDLAHLRAVHSPFLAIANAAAVVPRGHALLEPKFTALAAPSAGTSP